MNKGVNTIYRMEFNYDTINKALHVFKDTLIFTGKNKLCGNSRSLRI